MGVTMLRRLRVPLLASLLFAGCGGGDIEFRREDPAKTAARRERERQEGLARAADCSKRQVNVFLHVARAAIEEWPLFLYDFRRVVVYVPGSGTVAVAMARSQSDSLSMDGSRVGHSVRMRMSPEYMPGMDRFYGWFTLERVSLHSYSVTDVLYTRSEGACDRVAIKDLTSTEFPALTLTFGDAGDFSVDGVLALSLGTEQKLGSELKTYTHVATFTFRGAEGAQGSVNDFDAGFGDEPLPFDYVVPH